MNPARRHIGRVVCAWLVIILALVSRAPRTGVHSEQAFPVLPAIPVQRAMIIYRQGLETLMVESAFQSRSKDVAWILPLPAADTLELTEAGAIGSTASSLRPTSSTTFMDWSAFPDGVPGHRAPALATIFIREPKQRRSARRVLIGSK